MSSLIATYPLMPVNVLEVLFCFVGIFGSVLLWPNARLRGSCLLLGLTSILMAFNFAEETGLFYQRYLVTPALSFATGPAFYLFIRPLVYAERGWRKRDTVHFLPLLVALPFTAHTQTVLALGSISLVTYGLFSFRLLLHYDKATRAMRADADNLSLKWLLGFMLVFAALAIEDIVRVNAQPYVSFSTRSTWYLLHQLAAFIAHVTLIVLATRQPELLDDLTYFEAHLAKAAIDEAEQTGGARLDQDIFSQLDARIRQEDLYRQPRLSLLDLSNLTGLTSRDISQAINQAAGKNFAEYINGLRVDAILAELVNTPTQPKNLLHLATEAGFNSKSSFNSRFKAHTGQTPSAYLANLRETSISAT